MKFAIHISPHAQKRTDRRAFIVKGGGKGGKDIARVHSYKGDDQRLEEDKLIGLIYEHRPPEPLQDALLIGVKAFMPIPKSKSKKWKATALEGSIRPITKPDLDNLLKHLKDVCNGVFWQDDKQIVEYLPGTGKYYDDGAGTRWEIEIITLAEHRVGGIIIPKRGQGPVDTNTLIPGGLF